MKIKHGKALRHFERRAHQSAGCEVHKSKNPGRSPVSIYFTVANGWPLVKSGQQRNLAPKPLLSAYIIKGTLYMNGDNRYISSERSVSQSRPRGPRRTLSNHVYRRAFTASSSRERIQACTC